MSETVIHFDHAREAQELTGSHHRLLPELGKRLQVQLTARDTWVRVEGESAEVERASAFFDFLRRMRHQGVTLRPHTIRYALSAFVRNQKTQLEQMYRHRIEVAPGKDPVFPRTFGQGTYLDAIEANDIAFGIGPAGTGKTYLAMAMAVSTLLRGEVSRIILTRPAIEAGEALGYLPGDLQDKIAPYLRPLYDALYDMMAPDEIQRNMDRGIIEVAPLAYMRGRTLNHAFIILDEAQNTTPEQMLMFLTRLGFDSKCVITGDLTQIDLPNRRHSGLREAADTLSEVQDISFTYFDDEDVVRHDLVQQVVRAYRTKRRDDTPPSPRNPS